MVRHCGKSLCHCQCQIVVLIKTVYCTTEYLFWHNVGFNFQNPNKCTICSMWKIPRWCATNWTVQLHKIFYDAIRYHSGSPSLWSHGRLPVAPLHNRVAPLYVGIGFTATYHIVRWLPDQYAVYAVYYTVCPVCSFKNIKLDLCDRLCSNCTCCLCMGLASFDGIYTMIMFV